MLRHHVQYSAADAKRYYSLADYLPEGEELRAALGGRAAALLGVENSNAKEHFERICDNLHPLTGAQLTGRMRGDRIVGIDLTFDGPKGFAILEALTGDSRLRQALDLAAEETMREMEQAAAARVRKGGKDENRTTGNLVWYRAPHDTTRPTDGIPDPQAHNHFFVLNATWDPIERAWKAANLYDILRDAQYYEAAFHQRMALRLEALGYGVRRKGRYFEIEGVPQSAIDRFSRRTQEIEAAAREQGITDPKAKAELGAKTREHKVKNLSTDQLRRLWVSRLTSDEFDALSGVCRVAQEREAEGWQPQVVTAREALRFATEHVFERKSSAPVRELLGEALRYGVGGFSVEDVWRELEKDGRYTAEVDGRLLVTSMAVRAEEQRLIELAAQGRATQGPLNPDWEIQDHALNIGQRAAVHHLLSSTDFVTMVIGGAGVGKTRLLTEAVRGAEEGGCRVLAFAPSAAASRGTLRLEGFPEADTVATLLTNKEIQTRARGQVILIDEGALLGTKETAQVLGLAKELGARVWIVGDDKQHRSVSRGSPFELLQTRAGIEPAVVTEIVRQQGRYKDLVALTRDDPEQGWQRLQEMGWTVEVPTAERHWLLARDYLEAVKPYKDKGRWREPSALVVAPTHAEGQKVTAAIRAGLREQGKLGEEREVLRLTNLHLTEAQRGDPYSYQPGDVLQFMQNARGGFVRGQRMTVGDGRNPPTEHAKRFQAYRPGTLRVATGDRLRIQQNSYSLEGKRLDNGMLVTALGFDAAENILTDKGTVARDFGHLTHGYVTTSVSGQSRTVDRVLVALGAESLGAINRRQLYVDLSRGRASARVYTDDVLAVARAVKRDEVQLSATELAERRAVQQSWRRRIARHVAFLQRRAAQDRVFASRAVDRQPHRLPQLKREPERGIAYER